MGGLHEDFQEILDESGSLGEVDEIFNLIQTEEQAKTLWEQIKYSIEVTCKGGLLEAPRILDIGAREAFLVRHLRDEFGFDAIGVDTDSRFITPESNLVQFSNGDYLPFPDESFNIVLANGIFDPIYYDNEAEELAAEIARVLVPGGVFVTKDRNFNPENSPFNTLLSPFLKSPIEAIPVCEKPQRGEAVTGNIWIEDFENYIKLKREIQQKIQNVIPHSMSYED